MLLLLQYQTQLVNFNLTDIPIVIVPYHSETECNTDSDTATFEFDSDDNDVRLCSLIVLRRWWDWYLLFANYFIVLIVKSKSHIVVTV